MIVQPSAQLSLNKQVKILGGLNWKVEDLAGSKRKRGTLFQVGITPRVK
jgi:hypothetical protein